MPLPRLRTYDVDDANAREFAKRAILTGDEAAAAHAIGGPVEELKDNPAAIRLSAALKPEEKALLKDTHDAAPELARAALESREGRLRWLTGVMAGTLLTQGAFGMQRQFSEASKLSAARLLLQAHGDLIVKHQVEVTEQHVFVFAIPDNGRLPEDVIDMPPEITAGDA